MQTKCYMCEKNCICKRCKKSIDCRYSTQEDCKVCVECGRFEPSGLLNAVFREMTQQGAFVDVSKEIQNIHSLKRDKMKRGY